MSNSTPNWGLNYDPPPAEWNLWWSKKQDWSSVLDTVIAQGGSLGPLGGLIGGTVTFTGGGTAVIINNNATIGGTLNVTGGVSFSATAGVVGNATVGGTLNVSGATSLSGALNVGGNTALTGSLSVSGALSGTGVSNYFSAPGQIGNVTPGTGAFTTLSASSTFSVAGTVSGAGFSTYLASPPAIGGTVPATGAFSTLSASSTVSGNGFTSYLASPPAIGGTVAAAANFTTIGASGLITPTSSIGIAGTATNDSAQAGSIGEILTATVTSGAAVTLTSASVTTITSVSLTAGDWDVSGTVAFAPAGVLTTASVATNTANNALPTSPGGGLHSLSGTFTSATQMVLPVGVTRYSVTTSTPVYLVTQATFASTNAGFGVIRARRAR